MCATPKEEKTERESFTYLQEGESMFGENPQSTHLPILKFIIE